MHRRRITTTVSDFDDQPPRQPRNSLLTKLLLLVLIVFAMYGMKVCYFRYPPRWTQPHSQR